MRLASSDPMRVADPSPERVLIVDDDELILKALARTLESAGYECRCYLRPKSDRSHVVL